MVSLRNEIPVQGAVLNRFGEVGGLDAFLVFDIGNRPGHLQYTRISPGTQPECVDGQLQEPLACLVNLAELLDMAVGHLSIAVNLHPLKPVKLNPSGRIDPSLNLPGRLPDFTARQVPVLHSRNFDVDVDSVHQGTGDLRTITLNLRDGAGTFVVGVAVIAAGTTVQFQTTKNLFHC